MTSIWTFLSRKFPLVPLLFLFLFPNPHSQQTLSCFHIYMMSPLNINGIMLWNDWLLLLDIMLLRGRHCIASVSCLSLWIIEQHFIDQINHLWLVHLMICFQFGTLTNRGDMNIHIHMLKRFFSFCGGSYQKKELKE